MKPVQHLCKSTSKSWITLIGLFSILVFQSGCGLLIGNIRPVDEKSQAYTVKDLSKDNSDWTRLPRRNPEPSNTDDTADMAFQSKKSAAIISLNSSCRPSLENADENLQEFTKLLLLGMTDLGTKEEKSLTVQGAPALQTTVDGKLNGESVKIRTLVLHKHRCIFDLMYIARPVKFAENEAIFAQFIASLKLQD